MKYPMLQQKLWIKVLLTLFLGIIALFTFSCQKETFENEMLPDASFMNTSLQPSSKAILYYGAEAIRNNSKEPLVVTRNLENKNFKYFEKFFLKVQNGNGNSNKKVRLEIRIDGELVITSMDFTKGKNVILKELPELSPLSTMEVKLEGSKGKSVEILIECSLQEDVITDIDGNYYHTVKIGNRWWMAENLRTTLFNDGTPIELNLEEYHLDRPDGFWYCFYNNEESYKDVYGALYSSPFFSQFNEEHLCPIGWHISNHTDFWDAVHSVDPEVDTLVNKMNIGGAFKEVGSIHWQSPNAGASNTTGFMGLPGGWGLGGEVFYYIGHVGYWWVGHEDFFSLYYTSTELDYVDYWDHAGRFSIRCVKNY
jgi:uncharacterized protein (TIGR02145 family)